MLRTEQSGDVGAVAALRDHGQDDVRRIGVGAEGDEPAVGLLALTRSSAVPVLPARFQELGNPWNTPLRCAGGVRDHTLETLKHSGVVGRGDADVPGDLRSDLLDDLARDRINDLRGYVGRIASPAIGESGVRHRLLEWRQHRLALAEGHLNVVTSEPRRGHVGECLGRLGMKLGPGQVAVDPPLGFPWKVDTGNRSIPVLSRLVLDRP